MLMTGQAVLAPAHEHGFAVPAFNVSDHAMLKGLVEISEELHSPLIVAIHPDELAHVGVDFIPSVIARAHRTHVPVAIHLDHGATLDQVLSAIQAGFTSVMIDGSLLPFDENLALTKEVTRVAHAVGVSVEGELGTIGKLDEQAEAGASEIVHTDPADALRFVTETGVDSLAIAIGTSHGLYPAGMTPELRLDLLDEIKKTVEVPLVLHGGSGNPDDEIAQAASRGIGKINISSDIKAAYHQAMREALIADPSLREPNVIQPLSIPAMKKVAADKIRLFGADGKADLY
ncbi:ketose-bisphosphate aldolase (plasmid) [Streptomyces sp. BI20]|uniref:ketose-bisphosphate aldolase n=1 Tax=Streptomyces sp. BI20 TaxID=3403460 RepID=UPI003C74B865